MDDKNNPNDENKTPSQVPDSGKTSPLKNLLASRKKVVIIVAAIVVFLILVVIYLLVANDGAQKLKNIFNPTKISQNSKEGGIGAGHNDQDRPGGSVARVGDEYIFQRDVDYELTFQPGEHNQELEKIMLDKLVKDSVALQAAKNEKIIALGETEFNLEDKDYQKRLGLIKSIQTNMKNNLDQISGTMISVWFHNGFPAKIGLEKGKQEALRRIGGLHERVVKKEITIEQAGEIIKNDKSYEDLDMGYSVNAIIPFSGIKGTQMTVDARFDAIIWNTKPGEVTGVFLGSNKNGFTQKDEEAYYIFAQIKDKKENGNTTDYATWLEAQKNNYEVVYF